MAFSSNPKIPNEGLALLLDVTGIKSHNHIGQVPALNVYNRVLTNNEILDGYANYKTRFNLP